MALHHKEKICLVVCQYGNEVNGGAEIHCKMLAERLTPYYHVDVLTSTVINYNTFQPYYQVGLEIINQVNVRRFESTPFDRVFYDKIAKSSKLGRKTRRMFFRTGILRLIANFIPKWDLSIESEKEVLKAHGFYSSDLVGFVKKNANDYKSIILFSSSNPNTFFVGEMFPEKCISIPTAHHDGELFRSLHTHLFTSIRHIAFNTIEEQKLCENIFGKSMSPSSIVAVGVEIAEAESKEHIFEKFNLPENYILYFGRISPEKMGKLTEWFLAYKRNKRSDVKLVLTGRLFMEKNDDPDIIYTGFVTEAEKIALIENARFVINPSERESLSLLLLEAMTLGKPVLVNGKCDVMKQHCIKSGFACQYYVSKSDFLQKLDFMLYKIEDPKAIATKAQDYVKKHYDWNTILGKLRTLIESTPN
ncbi:glycosyltransferase [Belliella marina]|uniref:Glycosyltransferase n=1 Tax=Belliella marina TaxID=1644146 RepID=A0ABW4VUL7_9BACT